MGIKTEKRQLLKFFYYFGAFFIANLIVSISFITKIDFIPQKILSYTMSLSYVTRIFALMIIPIFLMELIKSRPEGLGDYIRSKGIVFAFMEAMLIIYFIYARAIMQDSLIKDSSLNMMILFIPTSIQWIHYKSLNSDRRTEWQKAVGTYEEESETVNTFFWRFKISFNNIEKNISRKEIIKNTKEYFFSQIIISIIIYSILISEKSTILIAICTIIFFRLILLIIDVIFGLVGYIDGKCTGFFIEDKSENHRRIYYVYVITDYENKNEIKITSDHELFIYEGYKVRAYHTLLSKRYIKCKLL